VNAPEPAGRDGADGGTLGCWLRAQRLAQGWTIAEMGRRLCKAAKAAGDYTIASAAIMASYVRRWERDKIAPTERYRLHYCAVLGLPPDRFGPARPTDPDTNSAAPGTPSPAPDGDGRPGSNGRQGGDVGGVMVVIPDNCPQVIIHVYRCGTASTPAVSGGPPYDGDHSGETSGHGH
jgi:transcriptional regulator with XRE-family HTH domain